MKYIDKILHSYGLAKYIPIFEENSIDFDILGQISADDFKDMGVPLGDRKRLLRLVQDLTGLAADGASAALPAQAMSCGGTHDPQDVPNEIRQITVLFADLVGSTTLAQQLDVEDSHSVLSAFHECCTEIVRKHGGSPARYIGDAQLACFGYPVAHECDARRAAEAGLAIAAEVEALGASGDLAVRARVGIATGLAMTGELLREGQGSFGPATGPVLNFAARLQSEAQPGSVLVDARTHSMLRGDFRFVDFGEHRLKGFTGAQRIWHLIAVRQAGAPIVAAQDAAPIVGREEELDLLQRRWDAAKCKGSFVLVSGEAGIGKTRLVEEFIQRAGIPGTQIVRLDCLATETLRPFRPIVQAIAALAGVAEVRGAEERLERLRGWVDRELSLSPRVSDLLAHLIAPSQGEPDSAGDTGRAERKAQIFETLAQLVERLGMDRPRLFVIEDMHWIDPTTREFLDFLVKRVAPLSAVFVCTFRPDHTPNFIGEPRVSILNLARLEAEQAAQVMQGVLGETTLAPDLAEEVVARADGVPLFVEELAKSAVEGAVGQSTGRPNRGDMSALPTTLRGSLLARLDRVPGSNKLAPVGAAIGQTFPRALLLRVARVPALDADRVLGDLVASGLLAERGSDEARIYTFKHALVRDAAYETMPKSRRKDVHWRIAAALEAIGSSGVDTPRPEVLARHWSAAEDHAKACLCWRDAALEARAASANTEAVLHFEAALKANKQSGLAQEQRDREIEIRTALYVPLQVSNWGSEKIVHNMERLRELRLDRGDGDELLDILHALAGYNIIQGRVSLARRYAHELLERYDARDQVAEVLGLRSLGFCSFLAAEFDAARDQLGRAIALCPGIDEARIKAFYQPDTTLICRSLIAWSYALEGDVGRMQAEIARAVPRVEDRPRKWTRAYALTLIASGYQAVGDAAECHQHSRAALAYAEEVGSDYWIGWNWTLLGWVIATRDRDPDGIRKIEAGIERYRSTGSMQCVPYQTLLLADAQAANGAPDVAGKLVGALQAGIEPLEVRYIDRLVSSLSERVKTAHGR
ncbi:MAG: AAA family ATPase [Pseudomonadota bacterium]